MLIFVEGPQKGQRYPVGAGRLTLGRDRALSEVVDPIACDPEVEGEPEALLATADARWSMATEWARIGPSLVIRLIVVVPADAESRVKTLLHSLI